MRALVVVESSQGVDRLVRVVRSRGLHPVLALGVEQATRLVARSRPDVVILAAGAGRDVRLLHDLERRQVPIVLVGDAENLSGGARVDTILAAVPDPDDIPDALEMALGHIENALPDSIEIGQMRLDLDACLAFVDGLPVGLPPKEFAILVELARRPGHPVSSTELVGRVWPAAAPATADDVHRHVYILRKLLGDDARIPPLIATRRGFGYVLNASHESA